MKKGVISYIIVLGISLIFLASNVLAVVYFSEIQDAYNLGDTINVDLTLSPKENGPISVELVCDSKASLIYFVTTPEDSINVQLPLTSIHINDLTGNCYFNTYYNGENYKSNIFQISKKLEVSLETESIFIKPGEEVVISGSAKRVNGLGANGLVEIKIPNLKVEYNSTKNISAKDVFYGNVENGAFRVNINLRKDTSAGEYRIEALAYEKDEDDKKTSEGIARGNIIVSQVLTTIDIAIDSQNFDPGMNFNFRPILFDQSGKKIEDNCAVVITDEKDERIFEEIFESDQSGEYVIPTNMSAGYYTIHASNGNVTKEKSFHINEKAIIIFEIENDTLIIRNIGNAPYNKDIQVEINGNPFVERVDLSLGGSKKFKLTGTNEEYSIKVSDGDSEITKSGVMLTGRAIGVEENRPGIAKSVSVLKSPVIWLFFIILLAASLLFFFRNLLQKRSFAYQDMPERKKVQEPSMKKLTVSRNENGPMKIKQIPKSIPHISGPIIAEQVLVVQGEKSKVVIVTIKAKNQLNSLLKNRLDKAVEIAYSKKGAVCQQGDSVIIIFSPILTGNSKNETAAGVIAKNIMDNINYMNRKFKDKIECGIAITAGEIVNKIENRKLIFTPFKTLIPASKSLADMSKDHILMSKEIYEASSNDLKSERKKIGEKDFYILKDVINHDKNKKFIEEFVRRNRI